MQFYSGSMSSICNIYDCTFWGCFQNFLLDSGFCIARIRWSLTQKHYVLYHSINVLNFKMSSFSRFYVNAFLSFPSLFGIIPHCLEWNLMYPSVCWNGSLKMHFQFGDKFWQLMKNAFYFTLKALFVIKIFKVLSWLFGHVEKRLD